MRKVLAISKYDSFAKTSYQFLQSCCRHGYAASFALLVEGGALSTRQEKELNLNDTIDYKRIISFKDIDISMYDVIYIGLTGGPTKRFFQYFYTIFKGKIKRPVLVTGYPGVILKSAYTGYSQRSCCDFVLVNSINDYKKYENFISWYGLKHNHAFIYGYSFEKIERKNNSNKMVLFAEQAIIPKTFHDRMYLMGRLLDYAESHPEHQVVIKPRIKAGEKTVFKCEHPVEKLLAAWNCRRNIPSNIVVSYENIESLLSRCNLLITVSSTVAIQAIYSDISTVIVGDFGPNEEMGVDFYMNSGCVVLFDDIINGFNCNINKEWIEYNIANCKDKENEFFELLKEKILKNDDIEIIKNDFYKCLSDKYCHFKYRLNIIERIFLFFWKLFYSYRRWS